MVADPILSWIGRTVRVFPAGELTMPAVRRISVVARYGAQPHFPGLRVAYPVTPYAAEDIMNSALAETNPVLFLASPRVYGSVEIPVKSGVPGEYYLGPALDTTV